MKYLFIDNFRGFSNVTIPVRDVNFLVGQNSTGKTSLLGILKLMSSPSFLFDQGLSHEHVTFGNFSDMVSAHSSDRSFFHIGLAWEEPPKARSRAGAVGWLLTYRDDYGIPRLDRYTFCRGARTLSLRFGQKRTGFKLTHHGHAQTLSEIMTSLPNWASDHCTENDSGYQKLATPKVWGGVPLLVAVSMCWQERESKADDSKTHKNKNVKNDEFRLRGPDELTFASEMAWIAPIRTKPHPTYGDSPMDFDPEGEHTPYLIRRLLRKKSEATKFHAFMKRVGVASGLFQDVIIKRLGPERNGPFEVDILLDEKPLRLTTVGYGVSQSLPVLVEVLARPHGSWFAIQQPEVHLHPMAQAALGDVIFEMSASDHKNFLIETHSDFMLDRFRTNYKTRGQAYKPDSQILFFERKDRHNIVTPIVISSDGSLPADQPRSYREFFIKEQMDILGM